MLFIWLFCSRYCDWSWEEPLDHWKLFKHVVILTFSTRLSGQILSPNVVIPVAWVLSPLSSDYSYLGFQLLQSDKRWMAGEMVSTKCIFLYSMVREGICWKEVELHPVRGWRWLHFLKPAQHSPIIAAVIHHWCTGIHYQESLGQTKFTDSSPKRKWSLCFGQVLRERGKKSNQ